MIVYYAPGIDHLTVLVAKRMARLPGRMHDAAVAQVAEVKDHAHGWQGLYAEVTIILC